MCCFIAWPAKCKSPVSYEKIMSAINTPFRTRLRACRSFFLTPGSRPDTFVAGRAAGWDAIIADLESTVAPADKEQARGKRADLVAPASANGLCAHRSDQQSAFG